MEKWGRSRSSGEEGTRREFMIVAMKETGSP